MRCLLLAVVAGLAVLSVNVRADEIEIDDELVAQMLGDLFDDDDFAEAIEQQKSNREARARGHDEEESAVEEKAAQVDPKDQVRYNSFIDTFFRRLNSYARSRFDPLSVDIVQKEGKKNSAKGGKEKAGKGKKKDKKKGKGKKDGKKDKKEKGNKKKGRHPKDLDIDEVEEDETESQPEVASPVEAEPEVHEVVKREIEFDVVEITDEDDFEEDDFEEDDDDDEESLSRVTRDVAEEDPADADETNRRGKPAKTDKKGKGKKGNKKKGNKSKGKGKGKKGKKDKKGGKKKGGKKGGKKSKRSAKSSRNSPSTSRASVSGIATLRRQGDVVVKNKKGGKEMRALFTLGPVSLKVSRKFSAGRDSVTKEARAVSPELTGKLSIHVDQDGKARMSNFRINRPSIVQVDGSLKKNVEKGGKTDNNFMEKSISRFSPVASKRLKTASREILSAGEPKAQSN